MRIGAVAVGHIESAMTSLQDPATLGKFRRRTGGMSRQPVGRRFGTNSFDGCWMNSSQHKEVRTMANASKSHFGEGSQGKKDGSGAMSHMDLSLIGENDVLSNRDKKTHGKERGLDGNAIKSDQYQDHSANRIVPIADLDRESEEE
jgi:hypothetical protein